MRQLFWKEWREQRWLPLIMTALTLVLNGVWAYLLYRAHLATTLGSHHSHIVINGHHDTGPAANTSIVVTGSWAIVFAIWTISGMLSGAGSVAAEIGNKTLPFLFSLPVRREVLWRVKVLTAVGTLTASILLSGLCWFAMDAALYGPHFLLAARAAGVPVGFRADVAPALDCAYLGLSCALMASAFVDRTISALLTAVISGPIVYVLLTLAEWSLKHTFPNVSAGQTDLAISWLPLFLMGVLGVVSYAVFVHGGSLTTAKRFKVGAIAGGAALLAASAAFLATAPLLTHGH